MPTRPFQYPLPWEAQSAKDCHTRGHFNCPACERMRMGHAGDLTGDSIFHEAFEVWISRRLMLHPTLQTNVRYISERTEWDYRQYYRALEKFFVGMRLGDIHAGNLHAYQRARAFADGAWEQQAGANRIRKEVEMLVRMLKEACVWTKEKSDEYHRLASVESDIPRAMSQEEQDRFLTIAGSSDGWGLIYNYAVAALQTTASTNEMRALRIGDVSLSQRIVQIRRAGAKNKYRMRSIPLETDDVIGAFEALIFRSRQLGATGPQHYLFPFRVTINQYDPTRGMSDSGLKRQWDIVRQAAQLPWLRPYDLRHTGITRMAENGTPIAVIMGFAGHMTLRMQQHYTSISMASLRKHAASTWSAGVPHPMGIRREFHGSAISA